jgi:uncharacterized Ntn-hydrolase superfamily protein
MRMYKLVLLIFLAGSYIDLFATWSIIIIDPVTREIGIAGASCSPNCYGIGAAIPGKGAVIVQAMSNSAARATALEMILANASPQEIISVLREEQYDPERQQYAILTFDAIDAGATYSGELTKSVKGSLTASGISVQGNTLASEVVLQKVFEKVNASRKAGLSMDLILMLALEAGSDAGGDNRCGEQKSTSAFITIFKPDDSARRPSLKLSVFGQHKGGPNAVTVLRKQFDKWKKKQKTRD